MSIEDIEARLMGPWVHDWVTSDYQEGLFLTTDGAHLFEVKVSDQEHGAGRASAIMRFLAAAPADIAWLLAEVKRVEEAMYQHMDKGFELHELVNIRERDAQHFQTLYHEATERAEKAEQELAALKS